MRIFKRYCGCLFIFKTDDQTEAIPFYKNCIDDSIPCTKNNNRPCNINYYTSSGRLNRYKEISKLKRALYNPQ